MQQEMTRVTPLNDFSIVPRSKGGDGRTVTAYAAVFNVPTEIKDADGHYQEQIAPPAFNRSVAGRARIPVFYNHAKTIHGTPSESASIPIGSSVEPPRPDGKGLLTVTRYNKTQLAENVLDAIKSGDITGQSFTGRFIRSTPERPYGGWAPDRSGKLPLVTRQEIDLLEYGPTPIPAYEDAAIVGVRDTAAVDNAVKLWDQAERREYLRQIAADTSTVDLLFPGDAARYSLAPPGLTGDYLRDLGAADEHIWRIEKMREEAWESLRTADGRALATAEPADVAEAGRARMHRDRVESAMTQAVAHRDRLERRDADSELALRQRVAAQELAVLDEMHRWRVR